MKRYTGQKALYEAISRSQRKAKRGSILERLRSPTPKQDKPAREEPKRPAEPVEGRAEVPSAAEERPEPAAVESRPIERVGRPGSPGPGQTWLRPKPVQLNAGRVEISVPYHVAIAIALAVVLLVLVAFKLGQIGRNAPGTVGPVGSAVLADRPGRSTQQNAATAGAGGAELGTPVAPPAAGGRDHWIVLAQYKRRADLDKVVEYFGGHGIALGVMPLDEQSRQAFADLGFNASVLPSGNDYLLITKDLYDNPQNPGTDGYEMRKRIAELGAKYRAPQGYEPFAPKYFSDAYGMKIR